VNRTLSQTVFLSALILGRFMKLLFCGT